jgi:hypothetical protein
MKECLQEKNPNTLDLQGPGSIVGNTEVAGLPVRGHSETSDNNFVSPTSRPNTSTELAHKCMNLSPAEG